MIEDLEELIEYAASSDMKVVKDVLEMLKSSVENGNETVVRAVLKSVVENQDVFFEGGFEVFDVAMKNSNLGDVFVDEILVMKGAYYV